MNSKVSNIDAYLGYWLRFVSNQVSASFQTRLSEKDVTVAEWIVLRILLSQAPCSLTALVDAMGMNKGALSRLTDGLEKRGLIKRNLHAQDRRLFSIELTNAGLELLPSLAKIAEENDAQFFGHLSSKDHTFIMEILQGIVARHGFRSKPVE